MTNELIMLLSVAIGALAISSKGELLGRTISLILAVVVYMYLAE